MGSLLDAVLAEPERFLSYIRRWGTILTLKDFIKSIRRAFGFHHVGKNIYRSNEIARVLKVLWEDEFTQNKVKKNRQKAGELISAVNFQEQMKEIRRERFDKEYKIKRDIVVKRGNTIYKKSYRQWNSREEQWLQRNKSTNPSKLVEMFNAIFKPRTKDSISNKRRRV